MCQENLMQISWAIQPGQELTTKPERNFARGEATNHVGKDRRMIGHNASDGIEPRNVPCCTGPRVSWPGSQQRDVRFGEYVKPFRG